MEKIKINANEIISEIQLDGKKIIYDKNCIIGYVPQTSGIKKWDNILLKTDNTERLMPCKSIVEDVVRIGYFEITETYPIEVVSGYVLDESSQEMSAYCYNVDAEKVHDLATYKFDPFDNIITSELGNAEIVTYSADTYQSIGYKKYVKYNGKYYYSKLLSSPFESINEITVDSITYSGTNLSEIEITERYFVENDKVTYHGVEYDVDNVLMEVNSLRDIGFNSFNYYKYDNPKYLTKLTIYGTEDTEFSFDMLTNGTSTLTLDYKGKTYEVHTLQDYIKTSDNDFKSMYVLVENGDIDGSRSIYFNDFPSIETEEYHDEIEIDGVTYPIDFSYYAHGEKYDSLLIYTKSKICHNGDLIVARPNENNERRLYVTYFNDEITSDGYVEYNGNKFFISSSSDTTPFITLTENTIFEENANGVLEEIGNVDYEIENLHKDGDTFSGIVNFNGYVIHVSGNTTALTYNVKNAVCKLLPTSESYGEFSSLTNSVEYKIVNKRHVYIFGEKYYVNDIEIGGATFSSLTLNGVVDIKRNDDILLSVVGVDGYKVTCTLPPFYPMLQNSKDTWSQNASVIKYIIDNQESFTFLKLNSIFGFNTPYPTLYEAIDDSIREENVSVFKSSNSIIIPVCLRNKNANNIDQDLVLKRDFVDKEIDKKINNIVDMEKDIYYPSICTLFNENNCEYKFSDVNEIEFNVHLRTRGDEWKIDDNAEYGWNIFDKYDTDYGTTEELENVDKASDLLDFLGFDNNDVFYQKSKIGKSFLRLRVYDSKDPFTQTLLATSTVFMNEGKLFQRYINGQTLINHIYSPYSKFGMEYTKNTTMTEEVDNDGNILFNSKLRLDSKFTINNRYECEESAEGFYYYIFKDIASMLHETRVYLKIDFNHAGVGKRIPLIFSPMTSANTLDFDALVKGFSVQDFLENRTYLPMEIKYDKESMKYRYYFRTKDYVNDKDNSKITINLWENKFSEEG